MANINRSVRASTRSGFLHGANTPAPEGGTYLDFERVEAPKALLAFDAVVQNPGAFEIITRDLTRVAFLMGGGLRGVVDRLLGRTIDRVTLDIWFEEEPEPPLVDVYSVSVQAARAFIEYVYQDLGDHELWRLLGLPPLAT